MNSQSFPLPLPIIIETLLYSLELAFVAKYHSLLDFASFFGGLPLLPAFLTATGSAVELTIGGFWSRRARVSGIRFDTLDEFVVRSAGK